jgi:TupA-like ATPgrasp
MDYVFRLELGSMSAGQLAALAAIGPAVQVSGNGLDDEQFVRMQWFVKRKAALDLDHPRTFSEKIQWLKLRERDPMLPRLVDKLGVRAYVAERIGERYLNPLYRWSDGLEDVDPASLPEQFIVKCTHGSHWNIPVLDRDAADWPAITARVRHWLSIDFYDVFREWVYQGVPRRVTIERLLIDPEPLGLMDYKVFCFGGRARFVQVDIGRPLLPPEPGSDPPGQVRAFYDTEWNRVPCELLYPQAPFEIAEPPRLAKMLELAEALAAGLTFVRVDLYNIGGEITFGELTFFPGNGFLSFSPPEYDRVFGDELALPGTGDAG